MLKGHYYFCCCFFLSLGILAQQQSAPIVLDSVVLQAFRIQTNENKAPFSVTQLSFDSQKPPRSTQSIDPFIALVPGVYLQNSSNFAQDSRIAIRGFGSRAAFGIRGIQLIVDGIPETTPDGQGQVDNLNLALLKNATVLRGPQAVLYGNASGGVLLLNTLDTLPYGKAGAQLRFGEYGLQQQYVTYGQSNENSHWIAHLGRMKTSGFREQSGMESRQLQLKGKKSTDRGVWRWQLNYTDSPFAEDAGALTLSEVEDNRRQARGRNVLFSTEEKVAQWKSGVQYAQQNSGLQWQLYGFASGRNFEAFLPFSDGGAVELQRFYSGHGAQLQWGKKSESSTLKLQWGYDFAYQKDNRQRFFNSEGIRGAKTLHQDEKFFNAATYLLAVWNKNKVDIVGGLRRDWNILAVDDQFLKDGNASDALALNAVSPSLGLTYAFSSNGYLFLNGSTAFETPSLSELSADPENGGGFNSKLNAQKTQSYELGIRKRSAKTLFDLVGYWMYTKDELTPYELATFPGRTFYQNAGRSRRRGIEVFLSHQLNAEWNASISYTYSDFIFDRFSTPNAVYSGNQLPGIPKHFGAFQMEYAKRAWQARLGFRYSGAFYADNANQTTISDWNTVNLNIQYLLERPSVRWIPFLGIQNLSNQKYFDNIRLNAFGQRYYEPAAGRNFFAGMRLQWK